MTGRVTGNGKGIEHLHDQFVGSMLGTILCLTHRGFNSLHLCRVLERRLSNDAIIYLRRDN
jgi:hypothetical protein